MGNRQHKRWSTRTFMNFFFAIATIFALVQFGKLFSNVHIDKPIVQRESVQRESVPRCVLVVIVSNSEDKELRAWHRQSFSKQTQNMRKTLQITMRFAVPLPNSARAVDKLRGEARASGDIIELNNTGSSSAGDDWSPAETNFLLLREARNLLNTGMHGKEKYLFRAASSYVINYKTLTLAVKNLPGKSVYVGSMVTEFPTPLLEPKIDGFSAYHNLPVHAYGGVYGVSEDILHELTKPATTSVIRKEARQDRAVGLALSRSKVRVEHIIYLKGIYHMCSSVTSLSCDKYKGFIAFKVAKDDGSQLPHAKVLQRLTTCDVDSGTGVDMVTLPQDSKSVDTTIWLPKECQELSTEGEVYFLHIIRATLSDESH